jgi:tetratricopeptide (TPR) repeat protein
MPGQGHSKKRNYIRTVTVSLFTAVLLQLFTALWASDYGAERAFWQFSRRYQPQIENIRNVPEADYAAVISALQEMLVKYPSWKNAPYLQFLIAKIHLYRGNLAESAQAFEKLINDYPARREYRDIARYYLDEISDLEKSRPSGTNKDREYFKIAPSLP